MTNPSAQTMLADRLENYADELTKTAMNSRDTRRIKLLESAASALRAASAPAADALEALRHADIDLSMLLPEIANTDMQRSVRKTLGMIDKARAALAAPEEEFTAATVSEFQNELGNTIRITIEGPASKSTNDLTPIETTKLNEALTIHLTRQEEASAATPTDLNKVWHAAEACWASNAPDDAVNILYYEILRLIGHPVTGFDINAVSAPVQASTAAGEAEALARENNWRTLEGRKLAAPPSAQGREALKPGEILGLPLSFDRDLAEQQIPETFQAELRALRLAMSRSPQVNPEVRS